VFWLLVVFAMLIVISLVFITSWAFSQTSICVNLLWFSTFQCSFCFHTVPVFSFCGVRYLVWLHVHDMFLYTAKFCYYVSQRTRQVPNFLIFQITRLYLYLLKFVQVIYCYWSYTWALKLIRRVLHLGISFICWFRDIRVLSCVFWSLPDWRSWWGMRQWARRFHSGWCTNTLGGLFEYVPEIYLLLWWIFFLI
jgi:hypothetical protein